MHEWALAEAVVQTAVGALGDRDPSRLRSIRLAIGELQAIERDIFDYALSVLLGERSFGSVSVAVDSEPATLRCEACAHRWGLSETSGLAAESREAIHFLPEAVHAFVRCPSCGSPDFRVVDGRGVRVVSIEVAETSP